MIIVLDLGMEGDAREPRSPLWKIALRRAPHVGLFAICIWMVWFAARRAVRNAGMNHLREFRKTVEHNAVGMEELRRQRESRLSSYDKVPSDCRNEQSCAICLAYFKETDLCQILPCKHVYHDDCVNDANDSNEMIEQKVPH
ncbi:hypothetical protein Pmar_PMAR019846 [Perkinsus marinus ATCC 50983]|uniref:RING-type domain-containing protein n=1 Tax=Perkinsus marinus (strain ATCC 50983 / TXsc) TaxID=423536 RepID=C5KBT3_PERM5|nr:hypothetical protein Pmar_PMAR019846 [Perkinsus marinus ATCC 50983]EER17964.1 hypothetical protein Pmar_PMAR019846 [Perkinsus marinus ATCC 50983]|eukprot:XP_002786168.1 hypothetical protein Pmar_PMAR019846 [Perkinsus marinus ATCC 50983]